MIYEINCGHCLNGKDTGAQGCGYKEENLTRKVGNLVMAKLKAKGHTVINCTEDNASSVSAALNAICAKANEVKADYFVSIHFNASDGQGHGAEIFTYAGIETIQAINILKNIKALGYTNRGVKSGNNLAVIRNTNAKAMLIECCFIDNQEDMKIFNADKMADAIVSGLIGSVPISSPVVNTIPQSLSYCRKFQEFYNEVTKTKAPISEDGLYGQSTQNAIDIMQKLIKGEY